MDSLKEQFLKLNNQTDSCFATTEQELKECSKMCSGHGCPLWETYADKQVEIAENYAKELLKIQKRKLKPKYLK